MATTKRTRHTSSGRKYGPKASKSVERAMHEEKQGTLRRGKHGHGGKVTNPKQAIAIGLAEARKKGAKVPPKKQASPRKRSSSRKRASSKA